MIKDHAEPASNKIQRDTSRALRELPPDEMPREKALEKGFGSLTVPELLALIIRTGTKGHNVLDVCRELMRRNDWNLHTLQRRSIKEIEEIHGLGQNKAIQIMAFLELIRRYNSEQSPECAIIRSSADIYNIFRPEIAHLDHEEMWAAFLDRKNAAKKLTQLSVGGISGTVVDIKVLMKHALMEQASGLIIAHNHPSGNLLPSAEDDAVTRSVMKACRTLEIRMLDHIIVTTDGYFSYLDHDRLNS